MSNKKQDKIFYKTEGDNYFDRNGPNVNKGILKAIKFLKPKSNSSIFEIGCGCGSTLKKINLFFKSKVFGIDTSKKAIDYAINKNNLKKMLHTTFFNYKRKKKFDIIITGGFLYVTTDQDLKKTFKKIFKIMKKNSYLIVWDYDTPYNYTNKWKFDKNLKSYKRNLLKDIYNFNNNLYLVSKQLQLKDGSKIDTFNNKTNVDNVFAVMIFKKIK